jgi:hypothetical protein
MKNNYLLNMKPAWLKPKAVARLPKLDATLLHGMLRIKSLSSFLLVLSCWLINLTANAQTPPTWLVQSNYFGERDAIAQPRTIRGMALSQDGLSVYTGLVQSPNTGSTSLRKVSSEVLAVPGTDHVIFGNGMPGGTGTFAQVGGQPVYDGGSTGTFQGWRNVGNSPEGIATDDRGNVYVALNSGVSGANRIDIFNSDLSNQVGTISLPTPRGVRIHKIGSTYYAYTVSNNGLQRYDVTNVAGPTLDATYTPGIFTVTNLSIDLDGTVYVAGNNQVRRISPTGTLTHTSATITSAKDVAVYYNKLYVIKDGSPSKSITVLNKEDLTSAGVDLTVPDFGITRSTISQFKSVDINAQGNLYISEENYDGTQFLSGGYLSSYTPPVTTFNPTPGAITGRIYFDRVVTSSFVEPDYANIQVTVTDNSVEISYNDWFSMYSLDGVNYTTPPSNPFTINNLAPGLYTIYIKDGVGNISTETFTIEEPEVITITITADDLFKYCGQDDPELTFLITDGELVDGDEFTGSLEREEGEATGFYAINLGTLSLGPNYSITFIPGEFEIKGLEIDASASSTPVPLGSDATLTATVSPAVAGVTVEFYLDGISVGTAITDGDGIATLGPISGLVVHVYKVDAQVGTCASSVAYLPVFDPSASFVTGGGWITSPEGALTADPNVTGRANFGFVSRYKKGKNGFTSEVDGNTEFQFQAGGLNFKSTMHEKGSLVISGQRATYRGTGTINEEPGYKFVVVAIDGNWNGQNNPDRFRIKISTTSDVVIYDNQPGSDENTEDASILGGGSIVIHEVKTKGKNNRVEDLGTMEEQLNAIFENGETELESNKILVYPNPASETSNIRVSLSQDADVTIRIFDSAGRLVMEERGYHETSFVRTLNLQSFSNGIYHVVVQINHQVVTKRLIKQ